MQVSSFQYFDIWATWGLTEGVEGILKTFSTSFLHTFALIVIKFGLEIFML